MGGSVIGRWAGEAAGIMFKQNQNKLVSKFWGKHFRKMRSDPANWQNNRLILDFTYHRMTGTPKHWLPWMLNDFFREVAGFDRVLSICCGDGPHELTMLESGKVGFLHAFDISEGALEQARSRFARAGIPEERYRLEIRDANRFDIEGSYDLVVSAGAAHHIEALERVFSRVASLISPDGYFALLEYIGPNRFQWTDRQLELLNEIVAALPGEYLSPARRPPVARPSVEELMKIDPSEAVRSEDIIPLVGEHFRIIYRSDYNGTLMHPLYPYLNHELADCGRSDFDAILRLILTFEDFAIRNGALDPDFTFIICRAK